MIPRTWKPVLTGAALACVLGFAQEALACAVCFGDPNSDMARGAVRGVLFMMGVIGAVLVSIAGIAVSWSRKARRLADSEAGDV